MLRFLVAATAVLMVPTTASAATNLIQNGGFENPTVPGSCCITDPPTPIPNWTVNAGNVNVVNGTFGSSAGNLAYENQQYLDLVGEGGIGSLSQSFATVAGQVYTLTLAFSHNLFSGLAGASASLSVGTLADVLIHSGGSTSNLNWRLYSGNFTATGATSTLTFTNLTGAGNEGILLDAVSVQQAVPEASTWAQLLIGFGLVGGAMRFSRRRRRIAIPAAV